MVQNSNQKFYSIKQICESYNTSRSFLYSLFDKGRLTPYRLEKKIFVSAEEFEKLIESSKSN